MKTSRKTVIFSGFIVGTLCLTYLYIDQNVRLYFPKAGTVIPEKELDSRLRRTEKRLYENPNDLKSLVDKGVIYFMKGPAFISDSLNAFNAAWQSGALDKRIFYYSGILYENLSLFEEAQRQYERFLRHERGDREIRLRLARLFFREGKWDDAISSYQEIAGENQKDVTALINCGLAYAKKFDAMIQEKKKVADKENEEISACIQEGIYYLESASKIQTDLPEGVYLALAKLYWKKEDFEKTVSACNAELKISTNTIEPLQILGNVYEKLNQKENALETYTTLSEKMPQNNSYKSKIKILKKQLQKK